jgi:hypothetical protein
MSQPAKLKIENVLRPGKTYNVDVAKFEAMKTAYLKILPGTFPGLTPSEIQKQVLGHLPQDLFPGGEKAGWWNKAVQLDLEAKGIITRGPGAPVRLWKK